MFNWKNAIIGFAAASVFSLLYLVGALTALEDNLYDFFLRFRANRERINNVTFLDVDDQAIAHYGFFPWPRSITADGLLRLKEYGVKAVIFDIEYIDRGPQGVDSLYLEQGLGNDFDRSFSEINVSAQEIFSAFSSGRIGRSDVINYSSIFSGIINREKRDLYSRAQNVARDNDLYLAQALALNGISWSTINLWGYSLTGEQAERRPIAERNFSYPVIAAQNASRGEGAVDVLPALPIFAEASKGAGYTNVVIDTDGVRRRVYLAQNIHDHWYLQLAFAPLMDYLGNPEIIMEKRRMLIKQAKMRDGRTKDIVIPLDPKGRMMLDWPKTDYTDSYTHISFAVFNELEDIEAEIVKYTHALSSAELDFFAEYDYSFSSIKINLLDMIDLFDASFESRNYAMANTDNNSFNNYLEYRKHSYGLLREIINNDPVNKVQSISEQVIEANPEIAEAVKDEADYIILLLDTLGAYLDLHNKISEDNNNKLRDKFVIMGRTDTGTTDYGANPFFGKYINVGTHGVVLDTILSESFIISVDYWLKILIMIIFISFFFMFSANITPVLRAASGFAVVFIFLLLTILIFRLSGIFFGPIGITFAMISAIILREVISYANSEKEKHFIRAAFSTYVSHDVVKEIIADPSRLQLGGAKRHMTAIFTDVKGFSTISETLGDPVKLVSLLNKYLSAMSDVVLAEKGVIDKFEGDAIIAFFGAPNDLPDHALRACVSAINMKKVEAELNKIIMEENFSPVPLLTRIGINTGDMVAGNMGTANKMNYTIMGNAVNLAARLEGVNKQYGTWVLASESTVRETGDVLLHRNLDRVRVVGINEPVRLCELLDIAEAASEQDKKLVKVFHEALACFESRNWKQAVEGFNEALSIKADDTPSTIYLDRLKQFSISMPDENWDGVYNLTSK
jgi:adenylate cyclase